MSADRSALALAEQVTNCQRLVPRARQLDLIDINSSTRREPEAESHGEACDGNPEVTQDKHLDAESCGSSSVAEVTESRLASSLSGQPASEQATAAEPSWPEEAELFELGEAMLTGGTGEPAPPTKHYEPAKATHELLVRVVSAAKKLKDERGADMHIVPGTTGRIDQQETRGYLLGAALGRGLLTRTEAAAAGLDARNKLKALEKRLTEQKEAARRAAAAARKAGADAVAAQAAAAAAARATIEREPITLALPRPLPPPKPPSAAGRKPAPPPPPPSAAPDPVEAWCQRNHYPYELFKSQLPAKRYDRAQVERAWHPQTYRERKRFEQTRQMQRRHNNACTCDDDVPSWLCQVHLCWALELGMCEGDTRGPWNARKKPSRRVRCNCMQDAYRDEDPRVRPWHRDLLVWQEEAVHGEMRLPFSWLCAPPGGWYGPGYCPRKAARALTSHEVMEWEECSHAPCD